MLTQTLTRGIRSLIKSQFYGRTGKFRDSKQQLYYETWRTLSSYSNFQRHNDFGQSFVPVKAITYGCKRCMSSRTNTQVSETVGEIETSNDNDPPEIASKKKPKKRKIVISTTPSVGDPGKVLGISVVANTVSWSVFQRKQRDPLVLNVEEIKSYEIPVTARMNFLVILEKVKEFTDKLPDCDLYIIDEPSKTQNTAFAVHNVQLRSFLLGLLASRSKQNQIIALKTLSLARMFKIHVGSERVSGQKVVQYMLKSQDSFLISEAIRWHFLHADDVQRELYTNAILLNLAYWKSTEQL